MSERERDKKKERDIKRHRKRESDIERERLTSEYTLTTTKGSGIIKRKYVRERDR